MAGETTDTQTVDRDLGGCPVGHLVVSQDLPAGEYWRIGDELRETRPVFFNTHAQGYWVVSTFEQVRDLYQTVDLFSSESFTVWDPNPPHRFVPTQIDPPEHIKYRQLLNPKFSPGAINRLEPRAREIAAQLIADLAPRGECDFVAEFGIRYPTEVFLELIGLPTQDADFLVPWVDDFFAGLNGAEDKMPGMVAALGNIGDYFTRILADRRANPRDPETDLIAHLLQLDRRRRAVVAGGAARHVHGARARRARHHAWPARLRVPVPRRARRRPPAGARRPVADPRARSRSRCGMHAIIINDARKAKRDAEFHGCPVKKGDMVMGLVAAANRDPQHYDRPGEFIMDRTGAHHLGFAAGPHRCLGAHLARNEMKVAVEEWLKVIPHFRVATDEQLYERGGQLTLLSLPLAWDVGTAQS